jgi:cellulose 1,4-beta-cellobiosidase
MTTPAAPPASSSETSPPSPPTNLSASVAKGKKVILSWAASVDNVGVAGYSVYRGGTRIGTTTTKSYTDTLPGKASSATYFIIAYDAAGNTSAASSSVTVQA